MKFKFFRYLLPFWKTELLALMLSGLTMLLNLASPYFAKLVIDLAYGNKDLKLFLILASVGAVIFIVNSLANSLIEYLNRYVKTRLHFDLNVKIFKRLPHLSYAFFQNTSTGQHLYKISYDIEQTSRLVAEILPKTLFLLPKSLLILGILFFLNVKIAFLALALMPFVYVVPYYVNRRLTKIWKIWVGNSQKIFVRLQEIFSHIHLVKAFGKEKPQARKHIRNLVENIRFHTFHMRTEIAGAFANQMANRFILGLILFYGSYEVITGKITLGTLSALTLYLSQLSGSQNSLARFFQQFSLGSISFERLEEILSAAPVSSMTSSSKRVFFPQGTIEFKNIHFGFSPEKKIFDGFTVTIPSGSHLALAGPSGCGKSTLINLLLRLFYVWEGEILIDGIPIRTIQPKCFYDQIGVALQEPYLWNDTIANNIRYGNERASDEDLKHAARIACIDEFIEALPDQYDTIMGENACKISEGQKQRLAIARAVVKKPKILILDEALSSVDAQLEDQIIARLRTSFEDSTILLVSHRASAVEKMDDQINLELCHYETSRKSIY